MTGPILALTDVAKSFGRFNALKGVSFAVAPGECRAVIGPNGAGKSTMINVLSGLLLADAGEVRFQGRDITGRSPHEIARLGIGRTFQISRTYRPMTVYENMLSAHVGAAPGRFSLSRRRLEALHEPAMASLAAVGLEALADAKVEEISHGDRKKLEFGMVIATGPRLLLLDEPTAGMGLRERHELMDIVARQVRERGITLLFVEHDIDVVFRVADSITVMALGAVFAEGTPDAIAANAEVQEIYLGRSLER